MLVNWKMYIFTLRTRLAGTQTGSQEEVKSKEVSLPITQHSLEVTDKQEQRILILHD